MTPLPYLLKLEDVSIAYQSRRGLSSVISRLTLKARAGEFIAILGDSGIGKSTLLHLVAGFLRPSRVDTSWVSKLGRLLKVNSSGPVVDGKIWIEEEDVTFVEPWRRNIGLVMQRFSLYPHMTVRANLGFPLRLRGTSRKDINSKVSAVSAMLKISAELEKMPHELSGGQQQRVAIGKLLLKNPAVALMDEPFAHLDWGLRDELRADVIEHFLKPKTSNSCVLFVTHDLEDARVADRILLLRRVEKGCDDLGAAIQFFPREEAGGPGRAWAEFSEAATWTRLTRISHGDL